MGSETGDGEGVDVDVTDKDSVELGFLNSKQNAYQVFLLKRQKAGGSSFQHWSLNSTV